jgi:cystathionine gamma-synthase
MVAKEIISTNNSGDIQTKLKSPTGSDETNPVGRWLIEELDVCTPIPPHAAHAVSVSLPKWQDNVDYEEGNERVTSKMISGYPRFCVHYKVVELNRLLLNRLGANPETEDLFSFPSSRVATECIEFLQTQSNDDALVKQVKIAEYLVNPAQGQDLPKITLFAVIFPKEFYKLVKTFWQHTGEIISSRLAVYCLKQLNLAKPVITKTSYNRSRYSKSPPLPDNDDENPDCSDYLEERFGRNLTLSHLEEMIESLKSRVASNHPNGTFGDVFLFPSGMSALYNAHRLLGKSGSLRSVCFGFPYTDTLKVLEKFGPGAIFLGNGDEGDLEKLKNILKEEKIAALFCEVPSNPLLKTPNLKKLRALADEYNFPIVIDDTLSNLINLDLTPYADLLATSLTKIFSGDSNVMGGSLYFNPESKHYPDFKQTFQTTIFDDTTFWEDTIYLERNSRAFGKRIGQLNRDTEELVELLLKHPKGNYYYYLFIFIF